MRFWALTLCLAHGAPLEYSGVRTTPYRCAPCYGATFVSSVVPCVESWACSTFVYGACHAYGHYGIEVGQSDFIQVDDYAFTFPARYMGPEYQDKYWVDNIQIGSVSSVAVSKNCVDSIALFTGERSHYNVTARIADVDLKKRRTSGGGVLLSVTPHAVRPFAYGRLVFSPHACARASDLSGFVITEYVVGDKTCPQ